MRIEIKVCAPLINVVRDGKTMASFNQTAIGEAQSVAYAQGLMTAMPSQLAWTEERTEAGTGFGCAWTCEISSGVEGKILSAKREGKGQHALWVAQVRYRNGTVGTAYMTDDDYHRRLFEARLYAAGFSQADIEVFVGHVRNAALDDAAEQSAEW